MIICEEKLISILYMYVGEIGPPTMACEFVWIRRVSL